MPDGCGLVLLVLLSSAASACSISVSWLLYVTLSLTLLGLAYYCLHRQLAKRQLLEANFQDLYNNAPCGYHSIDKDGTVIAINDTELSWLGYSRDEVVSKLKVTDLLAPESGERFQDCFPHLLEQGWLKDVEIQMRRKDGTIFLVLLNGTAIRDAKGNFVAARSTVFDITERKQAEAALRESEERLRLALDGADMGIWNWDMLTGKITWSNRHAELFGLSPDCFDGTYETFDQCLHPDDRESLIQALNRAIQERSIYSHQYRVVWPDGSIHWVEGKGQCFYNETGQAVRMSGTIVDISDRVAAQKALAASEKRLRTIIEAEPQCVKVLSPDGTIQEMNAAGLVMVEADDLQQVIGQPACSLVVPRHREAFVTLTQQALQGNPGTLEFKIIGLRGTRRWLETYAVPLRNEQNEITAVLGITRDITAQKQAEEDLRQSEEQLRLALEAAQMGIWDWNVVTKQLTLSSHCKQLLGLDLNTFGSTDEALKACVYPDDLKPIRQAVNKARLDRQDYHHEFRVVGSDGSIHWIEGKGRFFYDETGQAVRMLGTVMDISDRKHREEQLRLLESVVVNTNDAVLITQAEPIDEPGPPIVYANAAFTRLTGYSPEEVIGHTPRILQGAKSDRAVLKKIGAALKSWQPVRADLINYRKDGSEFWVELSIVPVANEKGYFTHWIAVQRDISDRKRAEVQLRQSEEKFRQLAENVHEVFWMRTADGNEILYVSPAYEEIWGRSCESLYANPKSFLNAIHPDDRQKVNLHFERQIAEPFDIEYRIIRPDGLVRWIRDRGFPIENESGEIYRQTGIAQDITRLKQAEAILRQDNEDLEIRVQERTAQLKQANERLQQELLERERVEQALRESEERWQLAIRGSNDGIWDLNIKSDRCFYSARWAEMLGYEQQQLPNSSDDWAKLVHPDDLERVKQARQEHLDGKAPYYIAEYRLRCKDGSYKWILSRAQAVWDEAGNPVRMVGSHTDISDRKRAEAALRESEERWQLALRGSNDGIWDWNVKTNEVFFSSRWKQMRGFEEHEVGNQLEEWSKGIHPDDRDKVMQIVADHFAKKTPFCIAEYRVLRKDNTYMWVCDRGQALWDEAGNVVRMAGSETDITERKQVEEALRKQACIFENLYDAVMLTNLDGHIIDWNPAAERIFGYMKAEALGKTPAFLHQPEHSPVLTPGILTGILKAGRWVGEIHFLRKDGTRGVCETVVVPLYNEQGEAIATIGVNSDITERKQAEAALRQTYDELEIRVQERTMELAKANQELLLENAERKRVEAELETRARQQAAVAELGQQALAGDRLDHLMNQAVDLVAQILEVEYCKVLEFLPDGKTLLLRAGVGWKEGLVGQTTVNVELDSQAGHTLTSTEPVVVEDLHQELQFKESTPLYEHEVVSSLSVLIPGQNPAYGILGVHTTQKRNFTKDDVHFLQATANVLATAIDRQQAEEALRRAHDELEIRVQKRTQDLGRTNAELQQEISDRKQVEEERAKLIAILEATPDFVGHASLDQQVRYLNSGGRTLLGFGEHEDLGNLTMRDAHPDWAYEILQNEGIPTAIQDGAWIGETAFLSHDGREIPVSQLLIAHQSPDGSVNLLSTVARDITQQKQIAATLQESERRWRSLLENVRLVVVGLDKNGIVEYTNPYFLELVGYTKAEVLGKDWFETFLPQHQRHRGQNNFVELLEHEFYTHDRSVILTKSGEERVIAWNNTLLQDVEGYVIGTLSIGEDITERQVIERMKDEFISVVSHELRTPLTSIHGALNLLSSGLVNTQTEKGRRVIEIAAESAERLVRLVNDILELERLESGKISLLKQRCNAAELMTKAIEMMQVMANRSGIRLSILPQAIEFYADGDRIIQVLTNLLGNAIKFSNRRSTVSLTVEFRTSNSSGEREKVKGERENFSLPFAPSPLPQSPISNPTVLFRVKDQGRGIPTDKLETIFERFHQVDASDSRKKGGTGLGLAICRSIVQQHGGQIWVESTLGEGSSFYFTLPVTVEDCNHDDQANLGD